MIVHVSVYLSIKILIKLTCIILYIRTRPENTSDVLFRQSLASLNKMRMYAVVPTAYETFHSPIQLYIACREQMVDLNSFR